MPRCTQWKQIEEIDAPNLNVGLIFLTGVSSLKFTHTVLGLEFGCKPFDIPDLFFLTEQTISHLGEEQEKDIRQSVYCLDSNFKKLSGIIYL